MTDNLKPCPFCGSDTVEAIKAADYDTPPNWEPLKWRVRCLYCYADGSADLGKSGAIEAWNTRPLEDKLLEACREMWLIMEEHPIYRAHATRLSIVKAAIRAVEGETE